VFSRSATGGIDKCRRASGDCLVGPCHVLREEVGNTAAYAKRSVRRCNHNFDALGEERSGDKLRGSLCRLHEHNRAALCNRAVDEEAHPGEAFAVARDKELR
jgi:hypothetical protein